MNDSILLAHGGGGRAARELIETEIIPRFSGPTCTALPDAASLRLPTQAAVFTTDSFVVKPLQFPGGNIGSLAVHGTVNDLAVSGAKPACLSCGLILEEGLPLATLRLVLDAMRDAAEYCAVRIVTGDTKVVERGRCEGLYINTAGIGLPIPSFNLAPSRLAPDDIIIVSGPIGDHGMAVLASREGVRLGNPPVSDSAPVHKLVLAIQEHGAAVPFMRDPTRGGVAAILNELASDSGLGIELDESHIPVSPRTAAAAELFGIDILHSACEGRLILVCRPAAAPAILQLFRTTAEGAQARAIGRITRTDPSRVVLRTHAGGRRLVDWPRGEILPRIC